MSEAIKTIDEIKAELEKVKAEKKPQPERQKRDWFGLVFCNDGWASVSDVNSNPIWLGKTDELIPFYKKRGFDGENIDLAIHLAKEFKEIPEGENPEPTKPKNHIGHLATKNGKGYISIPSTKSILDTRKKDANFLRLLDNLIRQDLGVYRINSELKKRGYAINQRTLTRWINKRKRR